MLKLCGFHISNYHNKVRLALLEKGIAFEEDATCRPSQKDEWIALSPLGKVRRCRSTRRTRSRRRRCAS